MNCDVRSRSRLFAMVAFTRMLCVLLSTCGEMNVIRLCAMTLPVVSTMSTGMPIFNWVERSTGT